MITNLILRVPVNGLEYMAGMKGKLSISNSSGIFGNPFERILGTGEYKLAGFGEPANVAKCGQGYPIFLRSSTVSAIMRAGHSKTNIRGA